MLGALQDAERVGVEGCRRLALVGRGGGQVPVVAGVADAIGRPEVVLAHRHLAREERVAARVEVGVEELGPGDADVVLPDAVVEIVPRGGPRFGDLDGLAVGRHELAGLPVGADLAQVVALRLEAPLDDVLGVEPGLGRVLAVLVDGQDLGDLADGVVVPRHGRAVGHLVCRVPVVGRLVETGLLEQARLVEQGRRIDGERDPGLALAADVVEADCRGWELRSCRSGSCRSAAGGRATGRGTPRRHRCRRGRRCPARRRTRSGRTGHRAPAGRDSPRTEGGCRGARC